MKSAKAALDLAKNVVRFPGPRDSRQQEELAFLPAALEILESPPPPLPIALLPIE